MSVKCVNATWTKSMHARVDGCANWAKYPVPYQVPRFDPKTCHYPKKKKSHHTTQPKERIQSRKRRRGPYKLEKRIITLIPRKKRRKRKKQKHHRSAHVWWDWRGGAQRAHSDSFGE